MRIVIADDAMLIREGTARLLEDVGFEVVGKVDDAQKLIRTVALAALARMLVGRDRGSLENGAPFL